MTCCPHTINLTLKATANRLGAYLVVTNRWAVRSAPIILLGLLQFGLNRLLGELMLLLEEIKQIKLVLNDRKYNKLKVLETNIRYLRMWSRISISPLGLVLFQGVGLLE